MEINQRANLFGHLRISILQGFYFLSNSDVVLESIAVSFFLQKALSNHELAIKEERAIFENRGLFLELFNRVVELLLLEKRPSKFV